MKPCQARHRLLESTARCDLPWGHEGNHKHAATGRNWRPYTQSCGHAWCGPACSVAAEARPTALFFAQIPLDQLSVADVLCEAAIKCKEMMSADDEATRRRGGYKVTVILERT